jgi:hypothetical protein
MEKRSGVLRFGVVLSALAATMTAPSAWAETDADDTATTAQITPYVWASGFGGTIRPGRAAPTLRVDKSFSDLMEDVDAAFFISGLVKHDRFVVVADLTHSSSSRDGHVPTGNPAFPAVPAEGRLSQTSMTALAGYRTVDDDTVSLDLMGGARAWWIRPKVTVPLLGLSAHADTNFVDPVFAARLNLTMSPRWSILLYGDAGGFGAGSDLTTQALVTANLRVGDAFWLSGGYRYLYVDYKSGNVRASAALAGPLLGATFTF